MIPIHYKIIAVLIFAAASYSGAFFFGVDYQKGKQAKKEVKVIYKKVKDHNEDIISLEKHTAIIAQKQAEYKKSLDDISLVDSSSDCPVSDLERVYNSTIDAANSVHFED